MKCWTCGHKVETLSFKCPTCKNLTEMKKLTEIVSAKAADEAVRHGDLERELQHYFNELSGTVSAGLSNIEHAVEWGFRGLSWRVERQTEVLRSIDETLKTPARTEANEYRQQAEKAERLGAFADAQERYKRALVLNIIDYRIYVGLAETLMQQDKFEAARQILERSLPYAPKGEIDYKSYSLCLTGHILACEKDYWQWRRRCARLRSFRPPTRTRIMTTRNTARRPTTRSAVSNRRGRPWTRNPSTGRWPSGSRTSNRRGRS